MRTILCMLLLGFFWLVGACAWGDCPEDPYDLGECDTIYIEPWPEDTILGGSPHFVRVPIYVTTDVFHVWDSLAAFVIPLHYTHTNPGAYCSVSQYWNTTSTIPEDPTFDRSVFRHMPSNDDPQIENRMAKLDEDFSQRGWDARFINMDGTSRFWMDVVATGSQDQRWWEGSRVLLATMTFRVENYTDICIDTCFWPPHSRLAFATTAENCEYAYTKIPRPGTGDPNSYEVCFSLRFRCGDASKDGVVDLADAIFLLNYVFKGGDPPDPLELGDVNADGIVDLEDIVYLLNYLFKGGPPPCEP
jgi:hypothetical protein